MDSPIEIKEEIEPNFMDILGIQEELFEQTDRVLQTLSQNAASSESGQAHDPTTIKSLIELFNNLKQFFLMFQHKAIDEIQVLEKALEASKNRETEWKELADLFSQYRAKVVGEMQTLKSVVESYSTIKSELEMQLKEREMEIERLQRRSQETVAMHDIMIRVQATQKRRQNLMALQKEISDEEAEISDAISKLPGMGQKQNDVLQSPEFQLFQTWLKNQDLQKMAQQK